MELANEIIGQLGGAGKLKMFTGAKGFIALNNGVSFRIGNRKTNYVKIVLNSMDTYDVTFALLRSGKMVNLREFNGIYNDGLKELFERETGMYLSFEKGGEINDYKFGYVIKDEDGDIIHESVFLHVGKNEADAKKKAKKYLEENKFDIIDGLEMGLEEDEVSVEIIDAYAEGGEIKELLKNKISRLEEKISGNDDKYSDYYERYGTSERQDMLEEVDRLKIRLSSSFSEGGEIDKNKEYKGSVIGFKESGTGRAFHLGDIEIPKNSTPKSIISLAKSKFKRVWFIEVADKNGNYLYEISDDGQSPMVTTYAEGGEITEINEDGSNLPKPLYDLFSEIDEDEDPYKEMERLRLKAHKLGYDFDYDLSGGATTFWKTNKMAKGGGIGKEKKLSKALIVKILKAKGYKKAVGKTVRTPSKKRGYSYGNDVQYKFEESYIISADNYAISIEQVGGHNWNENYLAEICDVLIENGIKCKNENSYLSIIKSDWLIDNPDIRFEDGGSIKSNWFKGELSFLNW